MAKINRVITTEGKILRRFVKEFRGRLSLAWTIMRFNNFVAIADTPKGIIATAGTTGGQYLIHLLLIKSAVELNQHLARQLQNDITKNKLTKLVRLAMQEDRVPEMLRWVEEIYEGRI